MQSTRLYCFFCFRATPATAKVTLGSTTLDVCAECEGILEKSKAEVRGDAPPRSGGPDNPEPA